MAIALAFEVVPGGVVAPQGFRVAGVRCGIKRKRRDVCLLVNDGGFHTTQLCAGVFTTNAVRAPCVDRNEALLAAGGAVRAVVVNAGNANAGNGDRGEADNARMATLAGDALGIPADAILTASTGIIGTAMPMELVTRGIADAAARLASTSEASGEAAEAILTTDTFSKEYAVRFTLPTRGETVTVGGMTKGSGMIAPNMATMLAFLTTDIHIGREALSAALREAIAVSFNCLTVDGDTSTNDMCLLLSSCAADNIPLISPSHDDYRAFVDALSTVCVHLAREVARDGEGATKLVTVKVTGADTTENARRVAKSIAESPLVKTALFGNDPNWGRILMAAGKAGVRFDPKRAAAHLAGVCIYRNGTPAPFDAPTLSQAMAVKELEIAVELGMDGDGAATFYTCDFSYDYVKINAEYHT